MSQSLSQTHASPQAVSRKISSVKTLQTGFPRSLPFLFGLTVGQYMTYKRMRRAIAICGGVCDWSVPRLAKYCRGIKEKQFGRDMDVIVEKGLIVRVRRRKACRRNDTNQWKLPELATSSMGSSLTLVLKPLKTVLKTTTRGSDEPGAKTLPVKPEAKARPAYSRQAENHPPEIRQRVEHNARARHHRLERSHQHERMAMRAQVGMYNPNRAQDTPTAEDQTATEAFWRRCAERKAEVQARAARERMEQQEAQRLRTKGCDVCKGSGKRTIDRAGRPAEVTCWDCKL